MNILKRVVHAELYRVVDGTIEFLLVKRVPHDGGFWQPVTGSIEDGEQIRDSLVREVAEETGITELLHISPQLRQVHWEYRNGFGYDLVHAVHVAPEVQVVLNPAEHNDHQWLTLQPALAALKFDGNRDSMQVVHTFILNRNIGAIR
jgi:dATP pyrophosphohydrolase